MRRSEIKNAPYNPRVISAEAAKRLRANIEKVGLVAPIVWNRTTGNCLGGHQRLAALDALEKSGDYYLTVAAVELDAKTEKEQNIFLNNTSAQGDWDIEKLASMFKEDELTIEGTGFDMAELYQLFGDSPFEKQDEELQALGDKVREAREQYLSLVNRKVATDDTDFYACVVFEGSEMREEFCKLLGVVDNKFVDGRRVLEIIRKVHAEEAKPTIEGGAVKGDSLGEQEAKVTDKPAG